MKVKSESEAAQSCLILCNPMDCTLQAPLSMGFSRQEYWSGVPLPSLTYMLMSLKPLLFHPINFQMVSYRCLQCDAEQDSPSCHSFLLLFKDFLVQEASFPSATLIRHSGLILNISLSHASHIWPVTLLKVPL